MKKKALLFGAVVALSVFSAVALSRVGYAAEREPAARRAVIVIIDRVTWAELAKSKVSNLKDLARRGSIGLLSNRTAKPQTTSANSYLTIGAGARAVATIEAGYPLDKSAFASLVALNKRTGYGAMVGAMASALAGSNSKRISVYGNADAFDKRRGVYLFGREVQLLGVDEAGTLAVGDTSDKMLNVKKGAGPRGVTALSTDYKKMAARLADDNKDVLIFETGDTRRADVAGIGAARPDAWRMKGKAIAKADEFVGKVARRLDLSRDLLMVVSPSPPLKKDGSLGQALTPIIIAGPVREGGLLTSPSTRRVGLVASTDIAWTVARFFSAGLSGESSGRPIVSVPGSLSFSRMAAWGDEYLLSEEMSTPIIFGYSAFEGALLALLVLGLVFARNVIVGASRVVRPAILFILSMPLGIFIAPLMPTAFYGKCAYAVTILLLTIIVTVFAVLLPEKTLSPLIFVTGLTTAFIIVNLFAGAPGDGKSAFGYTAISAGRFYGLGNHYLSVLIPAALVASLLALEKWARNRRRWRAPLAVFFAFIVFIVGYGGLGANTGAIIMATPAFSLVYMGLFSNRPKWRQAVVALATTAAAFIAFSTIDAVFPSEPTHLGALTRQVWGGASSVFAVVIKRKIMLNIEAFNYTYLSYAVIAILGALLLWQGWLRRKGLEWAARRHPNAGLALTAGVTGGLIGTVANDSGIAILAIVLGYLLMVMLYLEVSDQAEENMRDGNI